MNAAHVGTAVHAFLLAFPALFSIINPLAGALIFHETTAVLPDEERPKVASKVGFYSLMVMLLALWTGSYVLAFFGISLAALRIAGGVVVALFGWELLKAPEQWESRKRDQATRFVSDDLAFFPLTLPITTGPGTISVVIALGSERPDEVGGALLFFAGASAAAAAMAVVIALLYRWADRFAYLLGRSGERILTRLSALLLLCIGVQILIGGVTGMLAPLLQH